MKYFFFDIDGTLVYRDQNNKSVVPESTLMAILKLREQGHFVAIATSRPYVLTRDTALCLGFDNFVCDGGDGYCIEQKEIEILPLNRADCLQLFYEAREHNIGVSVSIDTTNNRYSTDDAFISKHSYLKNAFDFVTKEDFIIEEAKNIHKMCLDLPESKEYLLPSLKKIPHYRINEDCILVEAIDKYQGIIRVMEKINGDLNEIVVFGDGLNDLAMFKQAAYSIAMGNGCKEIKEIADFITKDVGDDGIYHACEFHGWIK